jgi:hypothetical protein
VTGRANASCGAIGRESPRLMTHGPVS